MENKDNLMDTPLTDEQWRTFPKYHGIDELPDDVRELVRSASNAEVSLRTNIGESSNQLKKTKKQLTVQLDADIVEWLKKDGIGYQARMNDILRQAMS